MKPSIKSMKASQKGASFSDNKDSASKVRTRYERPMGLTMLAVQFQQYATLVNQDAKNIKHITKTRKEPKQLNQETSVLKEKLIQKLIAYVLSAKLMVGDKQITLSNLGDYLNIPNHIIIKHYIRYSEKMGQVFNNQKAGGLAGVIQFEVLAKILEDRAAIAMQQAILTKSQGGQYKPFISSAVNDILNIQLSSTKVMMEYAKMLTPTGPNLAFNQYNQFNPANPNPGIKAIGVSEAMHILEEKGVLHISPESFAQLPIASSIPSLPEVRANHQHGNMDDAKLVKSSKLHHVKRRVKDEGLDEEDLV